MERVVPKEKSKKADRKKKSGKKGSQLAIRIEKSERDAFVELCDRLDTSAAREIRRFMREFVAAHGARVPAEEREETAAPAPASSEAPPAPKKARKPRSRPADASPEAAEAPPAPKKARQPRTRPAGAPLEAGEAPPAPAEAAAPAPARGRRARTASKAG